MQQANFRLYILGLYILLIPFDNIRLLPFSMSTIIGILYVVLSINLSVKFRKGWLLEMVPFFLSFFLFLIASLVFLQDGSVKRGGSGLLNTTLLYFVIISVTAIACAEERNVKYFRTILYFLFFSTLIVSLTGLYELVSVVLFKRLPFGSSGTYYFKLLEIYILRIKGTSFDPNYFSVMPLLVIMTANYLFSNKVLKVLINLIMVVLILATFSRMGVVCLIVYYAITFVSKRTFYYVIIPISLLLFPVILYQLSQFTNFLLEFNPNSVDHRFLIIEGSLRMIKENPFLGYGFDVLSPVGLEAHNTYLQLLMYGGVFGLLLVFLPVLFCYVKFKEIPLNDDEGYRIKMLLMGMIFPFFISVFFLSYVTVKFFWVFIIIFFLGKNTLVAKNEV